MEKQIFGQKNSELVVLLKRKHHLTTKELAEKTGVRSDAVKKWFSSPNCSGAVSIPDTRLSRLLKDLNSSFPLEGSIPC